MLIAFMFLLPFVQAGAIEELVNIGSGLVSAVNVAFDYIVKFIQWINLFVLSIVFIILWIGWFAAIFGIAWAVIKVEPYFQKIVLVYNNLNDWVKGKKGFGKTKGGEQ